MIRYFIALSFFAILFSQQAFAGTYGVEKEEIHVQSSLGDSSNLQVIPEVIWDTHEVILDGTIVDANDKTQTYDIRINQVFKGSLESKLVTAGGSEVWNNFTKLDSALFYLSDTSSTSAGYKYKVTDYSVKTSRICDARSLIQISPILPNEPNKIIRGPTSIPANYNDPCVPNYFQYDPDFFNFREPTSLKLQLQRNIPQDLIRCYGEKTPVFKSIDGSPACVDFITKEKLIHRGWAKDNVSFSGKILEDLRKGPQGITQEQSDYVRKIILLDSKVQELINGRDYTFYCCAYFSDNNQYPYHHTLSITINIKNSTDQIIVGLDLETIKVSNVEKTYQRESGGVVPFTKSD